MIPHAILEFYRKKFICDIRQSLNEANKNKLQPNNAIIGNVITYI